MESRVRYEGKSVEMDLIRHSTQFEYYIKLPDAFGLAPYPVSRAKAGTTSPRAKSRDYFAPCRNRDYFAPCKNRDYLAPCKNRDYLARKGETALPQSL